MKYGAALAAGGATHSAHPPTYYSLFGLPPPQWRSSRRESGYHQRAMERAMRMQKKWRVGNLQPRRGAVMSRIGFVLYDEKGEPCVMFGYGPVMK